MSSKFVLAAVGFAGAAVVIAKKLDQIDERLERIEKSEQTKPVSEKQENWNEIADVVFDLIRGKEEAQKTSKKTKRKVAFSAAKGVSKAAGRAAWNKITRKDK